MTMTEPWIWCGARAAVRQALEAVLGPARAPGEGAAIGDRDLVVIDSLAAPAELGPVPGGHAFAAVSALRQAGARVYVVVDAGDRVGRQLARFCLAAGIATFDPATGAADCSELLSGGGGPRRPSMDGLLERLERDLAASGDAEGTVQRLLRFEREHSPLQRLQDPETGLFDGPYATWKLDEEWKRAQRFHEPLSLVLLDLGPGPAHLPDLERQAVLAAAAGVFLNECRDIDVLARFTPSTFLFLLPGTGPDGAEIVARRMMVELQGRLAGPLASALAAGVATAPAAHLRDRRAFLLAAEACLKRAQAAGGGGKVVVSWQ
ncbi:MAG: GGDEF domain-containing protein [Planctomycetota bacterium]